jgi:hypothetical protein
MATSSPPADNDGDADVLPRDPSAYRPTQHFAERFKGIYDDYCRHLDSEIVAECIQEGEVHYQEDGKYWLFKTFGGIRYKLVVNPTVGNVITGYPVAIDRTTAMESGRWSTEQIEEIQAFLDAPIES